jgi:hypothetical protein
MAEGNLVSGVCSNTQRKKALPFWQLQLYVTLITEKLHRTPALSQKLY